MRMLVKLADAPLINAATSSADLTVVGFGKSSGYLRGPSAGGPEGTVPTGCLDALVPMVTALLLACGVGAAVSNKRHFDHLLQCCENYLCYLSLGGVYRSLSTATILPQVGQVRVCRIDSTMTAWTGTLPVVKTT